MRRQLITYWENFVDSTKLIMVLLWTVGLLLGLLELKRYYNIDVFPNYDSPVDDLYGTIRGTLSEWFFGDEQENEFR